MTTTTVGEVRPSQLLWTYGPGALVDLPNLSVITMGLDRWEVNRCPPIEEARLLEAVRAAIGPDDSVIIHAGIIVSAKASPDQPFQVVDLAGTPSAATVIHHGSMDNCESSYQLLAQWIEQNGYRTSGFAREVYLDYDPENAEQGVTELQMPVEKA